jgi:hypothetical protein
VPLAIDRGMSVRYSALRLAGITHSSGMMGRRDLGRGPVRGPGHQLGDVALALFDGYFIATEAGAGAARGRLIEQLASAIHALAVGIRDFQPPPGYRR